MFLLKQTASFSKGTIVQPLLKKNHCEISSSISYRVPVTDFLPGTDFRRPLKKLFHVTKVNSDIESGLRAMGSGAAIMGVVGPGIGVGYIFGNAVNGMARNPSLSQQLMLSGILGAVLCETLGLIALLVSFVLMPK